MGVPRWSVESRSGVGILAAAIRAGVVSLAPWVFWRRIHMHHDTSPWRLVVAIALLALALHPVRALASLVGWVALAIRWGYGPFGVLKMLDEYAWPRADFYASLAWPFGYGGMLLGDPRDLVWLPAPAAAMAVIVGGAHTTYFRVPVRTEHLVRIALYSLLAPVLLVLFVDGVLHVTEAVLASLVGSWRFGGVPLFGALRDSPALMGIVLLWWVLFWYVALRRYLESPRAATLTLLAAALSVAVLIGAQTALDGLLLRLDPPEPTFP